MIIFRAFISEILKMTMVILIVVVMLFMVLRGMIFLGQAAEGLIPASAVFSLVALAMVANLDILLPLIFFIGVLMVMNRWYSDREIDVLASSGVGISRFLMPLFVLNVFLISVVAVMSFYVAPLALTTGYDLESQYRQSQETIGVKTGRFTETKNESAVYYVEGYNQKRGLYTNIFVNHATVRHEALVKADYATRILDQKTQDQFLLLLDGTRYEGTAGSRDYRIIEFEKYALRIEPPMHRKLYLPVRALPSSEIRNSATKQHYAEWVWRIAKIFTIPILSIFALALSHVNVRTGKATGLIPAFLVFLTYQNFLGYSVSLIRKGEFTTSWPVWLVHGTYAILALYCLYRRNYNLPLLPEWRARLRLPIRSRIKAIPL